MKKELPTLIWTISVSAFSQVGINTRTLQETLQVVSSPIEASKFNRIMKPSITGNQFRTK